MFGTVEVVMMIRRGPEVGFERRVRFERIAEIVYEPLQRYLGRRVDADRVGELLDDVLVVLWRRLDDVPSDDPLPWSYGVARRCLANDRRRAQRHLRLVERVRGDARLRADHGVGTPVADTMVWDALDALGDSDRELVRLWAWEQLEPREIAVVLGTTPNAVSIRLSRVKAKLRSELERKDPVAGGQVRGGRGKERGT